jgi:hypothetical protein
MLVRKCFWVGVLLCAGLSACNGDDKEGAGGAGIDPALSEELAASEDDLLGRRDALFNMRQGISDKRAALDRQRAEVQAAGGDTTEIDKEAQALIAEEASVRTQESELNQTTRELFTQLRELQGASAGGGGPEAKLTMRESGMAGRERQLARRESELGSREAALAKREEGLASKWKDSCAGALPTTIIRTVDTKGSSYTKKDVEPLLTKARRVMSKKGLLKSDLPDQAKGLEKEANQGMKDGDYGRARLAASQLLGTVNAIKINKGFIAAKIARLNQRIGGKSLSSKSESLFREATSSYGDAKFSSANGKLNKIYSSLR